MKVKHFLTAIVLLIIASLVLAACAAPPSVAGFFEGYDWQTLVALFFWGLFGLWPSADIFQKFKEWFGVVDKYANYLVIALSLLLTGLFMWLTGALNLVGFEWTFANMVALAGSLYTMSQIAYQRFKDKKRPDLPEAR